ncbi:unnamed protein product [Schistosoma mattheei]|uniref:Uncharacterized protein n=1 Tax=Schistosoma mattheei TaxID=31246 RepID=A0A183NXU0_9TREM|nr:unnamed protein product [Schistosoma mattheei]
MLITVQTERWRSHIIMRTTYQGDKIYSGDDPMKPLTETSYPEVQHRVFGHSGDKSVGVTILKHRLRWLGHVLQMSSQRIPRRALFFNAQTG